MCQYYCENRELMKIAQYLNSVDKTDVSHSQSVLNSIMFKMNLLDPSGEHSRILLEKIQGAIIQQAHLEWLEKVVYCEGDLTGKDVDKYKAEVNKFVEMLEQTKSRILDTQAKEIIAEMARVSRVNLRAGMQLYIFGCKMRMYQNSTECEANIRNWGESSSPTWRDKFRKIFTGTAGKFVIASVSMVANVASMYFLMQAAGSFHSVSTTQKVMIVSQLIYTGIHFMLDLAHKVIAPIYQYFTSNRGPPAGTEVEMTYLKQNDYTSISTSEVGASADTSMLETLKKNAFSLQGFLKILLIIGLLMSIAVSLYNLIDSWDRLDATAITLEIAIIVSQVIEGGALLVSLFSTGSTACSLIGSVFSAISLGLIVTSMILVKPESYVSRFVRHADMEPFSIKDRCEIETYNKFEQNIDNRKSSTVKLVRDKYELTIDSTGLIVTNKSDNSTSKVVEFQNNNKAAHLTFAAQKVTAQNVDSTLLASMTYEQKFMFTDYPLYFKLDEKGQVWVRNNEKDEKQVKQYPITSSTFLAPSTVVSDK